MDASATGRLELCTADYSFALIAISLFLFIIFVNVVLSQRWGVVCGLRLLKAYNKRLKRKPGVGFFGFRSSRCDKSRSRVLVDGPIDQWLVSVSVQMGERGMQPCFIC